MSAHLQWTDERPDVFRAPGRSGRLYRIGRDGPGDWYLRVTPAGGQAERDLSRGTLADMKLLASVDEAEHAPPVTAQRIAWTRIRADHWWGVSASGPAYKALKVGRIDGETVWKLEAFANEDAEHGEWLDEGTLNAMKRRAALHAAEAALEVA